MDINYIRIMVMLFCGYIILVVPSLLFAIPFVGASLVMLALLFRDINKPPHD